MKYNFLPQGVNTKINTDAEPELGGDLNLNNKTIFAKEDTDVIFKLGDNIGVNKIIIQNIDGDEVANVNSNGEIKVIIDGGTL